MCGARSAFHLAPSDLMMETAHRVTQTSVVLSHDRSHAFAVLLQSLRHRGSNRHVGPLLAGWGHNICGSYSLLT
jgi:hypothetical protein